MQCWNAQPPRCQAASTSAAPDAQTERAIRFVGLSTALANAQDLADWLGITGPVRSALAWGFWCSFCRAAPALDVLQAIVGVGWVAALRQGTCDGIQYQGSTACAP